MPYRPQSLGERYARAALDHFLNPRNAGELENPDGVGESGDPSCGDAVRITIRVEHDCIADIRFLTFGCPAAIAVASCVTELAWGKTFDEAVEITELDVSEALGGLPPEKLHCSAMAIGALRASVHDHVTRFLEGARRETGKEGLMPTYGYECEKCGHTFERFQAMSDAPVGECPECGGKVKRLIAAGAGIISKGAAGPSCGLERPCCGRDSPCDERPCDR